MAIGRRIAVRRRLVLEGLAFRPFELRGEGERQRRGGVAEQLTRALLLPLDHDPDLARREY